MRSPLVEAVDCSSLARKTWQEPRFPRSLDEFGSARDPNSAVEQHHYETLATLKVQVVSSASWTQQ